MRLGEEAIRELLAAAGFASRGTSFYHSNAGFGVPGLIAVARKSSGNAE